MRRPSILIQARLRTCICFFLGALLCGAAVQAQILRGIKIDGSYNHDDALKEARKEPLAKMNFLDDAGQPLSEEAKSQAIATEKIMIESTMARAAKDYQAAYDKAKEAASSFRTILGKGHFFSIAATGESRLMSQVANMTPKQKDIFALSDMLRAEGFKAFEQGNFIDAEKAATKTLEIRQKLFGAKPAPELTDFDSLRLLGMAQTALLKFADAEKTFAKAIDALKNSYGINHPKSGVMLDRQGWLFICTGKSAEALETLRPAHRVLAASEGDTLSTARVLDHLGTAFAMNGEMAAATTYKLRGLVIREALSGPDSADTAESLSNLAWLYEKAKLPDQAAPLRKKAMAAYQASLGPNHPYTLTEAGNLARLYINKGELDEAIKLYERIAADEEQRRAPLDPAGSWNGRLAGAYLKAGRTNDAARAMATARGRAIATYEAGDTKAALGEMEKLATILEFHGQSEESLKLRRQILTWNEKNSDKPTPEAVHNMERLGFLLHELGQDDKAKAQLEQAVAQSEKANGDDSLATGACYYSLSVVLESMNDLDGAEKSCASSLKISEDKSSENPFANTAALIQMSRIFTQQKRLDLAEFSFAEAKKLLDSFGVDDHVAHARYLMEFAELQVARGNTAEAAASLKDAVEHGRKAREKNPSNLSDETLARAIRKLVQFPGNDTVSSAQRQTLQTELKQILEKLRDADALDAEFSKWLAEADPNSKG